MRDSLTRLRHGPGTTGGGYPHEARVEPMLLDRYGEAEGVTPLPRVHDAFNERFLQDLLADHHPNLLPMERLREDVGDLLCIGREVPTRDSGAIDNLFLSAGGYVVVAETKLWRNPQARREVVQRFSPLRV